MVRTRQKHPGSAALENFRRRAAEDNLVPLWQRLRELLTAEPEIRSVPQLWHYDALRPLLLEAAELITAEEAERRVLILENSGLPGSSAALETLFAGLQLVMPGEVAPSHRHSPAALRFIVEGAGAYTAVDGQKLPMSPGDMIVTPSWSWHDHGHEGSGPFIWLDVLDLPLVRNSGAIFFEEYPDRRYPESAPPMDGNHRFGSNMVPLGFERQSTSSPLLSYPYAKTREALEQLKRHSDWDACYGLKMEFIDPTSGSPAISTISTFVQLMPNGFSSAPYKSTESTIFSIIEGRGTIECTSASGVTTFRYSPRDIIAIPSWNAYTVMCETESIFFCASDRVTKQKLGIWKESR